MRREQIYERPINYVQCVIYTESGCQPSEGEYGLSLCSFIGALDLNAPGGADDIQLIKDAIDDGVDFDSLPSEGETEVILRESGEWDDMFWHKYYEVERITHMEAA
jgi:hypothetical protein